MTYKFKNDSLQTIRRWILGTDLSVLTPVISPQGKIRKMIITVDENYRHQRDHTEQQLFTVVEQNTPDSIKTPLFPQDEPQAFTFQLDKELIARVEPLGVVW